MAVITPFRAIRYNPAKVGSMEDVVTPPYDVIDDRAQAAFLAKNPYNMIQLDLSKRIGADADGDRYDNARRLFGQWQADSVLLRDDEPALYLYFTEYLLPSGGRRIRKGFVSLVRLADFDRGIVKPHERTFASVTDDRLRLMDTCQAQFSQIFSLYSDPCNELMAALESARPETALCRVTDQDGCVHSLWRVTDRQILARVQAGFLDKALYIADGHHRYTTALRLRDLERQRNPSFNDAHPANQVAMYLCPMEDPGLSILPTHRLVRIPERLTVVDLAERLAASFELEEISGGSREGLVEEVLGRMVEHGGSGRTSFGLYHPREDRCFLLRLRAGEMERHGAEIPAPLRELDVVVLSELVLHRLLELGHERCEAENLVDYFSDPDDALDVAVKEAGQDRPVTETLFLMNPTTVAQVRRVADEGLIMPHKSTYFYPKILTGLLVRPIAGD
ncbi:MAG: DUF1015 domain-containing protein [Thermodesulfobacteriota bacterium]